MFYNIKEIHIKWNREMPKKLKLTLHGGSVIMKNIEEGTIVSRTKEQL